MQLSNTNNKRSSFRKKIGTNDFDINQSILDAIMESPADYSPKKINRNYTSKSQTKDK